MSLVTGTRRPRSCLYDGAFYGAIAEPMLRNLHRFIADHLPPGERVLDACCGTGGLSRILAKQGRTVRGVDLSPRHVAYARRRAAEDGLDEGRLAFEVADIAGVAQPPEGPFDVATIVLALHEMPSTARLPVVEALTRAARRVMIVDFAAPMPWNVAGLRNRGMELLAGREHFGAFRDYQRRGGLPGLLRQLDVSVELERPLDAGTMGVWLLASPLRAGSAAPRAGD